MNGLKQITVHDFTEPTVIIRLTDVRVDKEGKKKGRYYFGIENDAQELYDATRSAWSTRNDHKIPNTRLALAVHNYIVVEVYRIAGWHPGGTTIIKKPVGYEDPHGRIEFVGTFAEDSVRQKFKGASVKGLFKRGNVCPVMVFG